MLEVILLFLSPLLGSYLLPAVTDVTHVGWTGWFKISNTVDFAADRTSRNVSESGGFPVPDRQFTISQPNQLSMAVAPHKGGGMQFVMVPPVSLRKRLAHVTN